jgi:hypothetical protein
LSGIYQQAKAFVAHPEAFTSVKTTAVQQVVEEYRAAHAAN